MEAAQSIQPFDWHRIFLGDELGLLFLLEIVFRTVVMYGYALIFARAIGKRGVGQISPFELGRRRGHAASWHDQIGGPRPHR